MCLLNDWGTYPPIIWYANEENIMKLDIFPLRKWASNWHQIFRHLEALSGNMTYWWWQGNYFWARHSGAPLFFTTKKTSTKFLFTTKSSKHIPSCYPLGKKQSVGGTFWVTALLQSCQVVIFTFRYKNHHLQGIQTTWKGNKPILRRLTITMVINHFHSRKLPELAPKNGCLEYVLSRFLLGRWMAYFQGR